MPKLGKIRLLIAHEEKIYQTPLSILCPIIVAGKHDALSELIKIADISRHFTVIPNKTWVFKIMR